jgi:hypothetical protein
MRHYAARRGSTLESIYTDAGVSGVTLDRPALQKLIAECRAMLVTAYGEHVPARVIGRSAPSGKVAAGVRSYSPDISFCEGIGPPAAAPWGAGIRKPSHN